MSPIRQQLGESGDHLAAERVRERHYMVIARDCHRNTVELNSISPQCSQWVFRAVRTDRGRRYESPEESIIPAVNMRLIAGAVHCLYNSIWAVPYHIDVMAITRTPGGELVHIEQWVDGIGC